MDFSEKAVAHAMHIILRCYEFKRQLPVDSTDYVTGIKEFIKSKQIDLQEEIKRKARMRRDVTDMRPYSYTIIYIVILYVYINRNSNFDTNTNSKCVC